MTPMLEKMCRAMAVEEYCSEDDDQATKDRFAESWRRFEPFARAALLAIREPDSTMMAARIGPADEPYWYERALEADFTAMIDSILGEKPEAPPEGS